jgi:hypothetical protein
MKDLEILLDAIDNCLQSNIAKQEIKELFTKWYHFAKKYVIEEELIYEWQNDMDARKLLHIAFANLNNAEKTKMESLTMPLDIKIKENTFEVNECIWGSENEKVHKYNRVVNWYYYRVNQKLFDESGEPFTKRPIIKTDWEALSQKLGVLKDDGSELYEGINSSQALEEILGDDWLRDAVNTFIDGTPGNELAIKTLRLIYSPRAAAMAFNIYNKYKDTNFDKANIAVWALSDIRTKDSLDYVEEIIKRPEYETQAFSVLRNLIFDHLQWFDGQRLLDILDSVSDDLIEDAQGLKIFIRMESDSLLPDLTNNFSVKKFKFLEGTIIFKTELESFGINIPIETFSLDDRKVETELRLDRILLTEELSKYIGQKILFPTNPTEGYIDGSVYLKDTHNPIDVTEIEFISLEEKLMIIKLRMNFLFEYEGIGFKNEELTKEVRLLITD